MGLKLGYQGQFEELAGKEFLHVFFKLVGFAFKPNSINITLIFNELTITEGKNGIESILELIHNILHETMPTGCFPAEFSHI
jgi:hypothetical protein